MRTASGEYRSPTRWSNISTDAGAQIASDLGKGVIQGVSGYVAKKMRTVKVTLKAGHRLLLHSPEQ